MRVTIKDIAKETNLSIATVSLVLNNKADNISSKTRKLVIDTAKRLNYHPNQLAVSLVKKRTHTIGLIIPDIGNSFFPNLQTKSIWKFRIQVGISFFAVLMTNFQEI